MSVAAGMLEGVARQGIGSSQRLGQQLKLTAMANRMFRVGHVPHRHPPGSESADRFDLSDDIGAVNPPPRTHEPGILLREQGSVEGIE